MELARTRADILITTGGLGPTCDDLTKNVLAGCFGKRLVFHAPSARRIEDYFRKLHSSRPMTENNYQQAMLPEGCTVLDNDWGTAPGVAFEADGVHVIMLPGPPRECRAMFTHRAVPYLQKLSDGVIVSRTLKLFGIGESSMEAQLRDEMNSMTNPTLAPYAKEGECELRITAHAADEGRRPGPHRPGGGGAEGPLRPPGLRGGRALPGGGGAGAAQGEGPHLRHRRELHRRAHRQANHRPAGGLGGLPGGRGELRHPGQARPAGGWIKPCWTDTAR